MFFNKTLHPEVFNDYNQLFQVNDEKLGCSPMETMKLQNSSKICSLIANVCTFNYVLKIQQKVT